MSSEHIISRGLELFKQLAEFSTQKNSGKSLSASLEKKNFSEAELESLEKLPHFVFIERNRS